MLIEVHISEVDAIKYTCANTGVSVQFMESACEGLVKALILNNGREISPELAWRLCAVAECHTRRVEYQKHHISEAELMPENYDG